MLLAREEFRLVWAARTRGEGEGQDRVNADLRRTFTYRLLDSVKYMRKTNAYKVLRSR